MAFLCEQIAFKGHYYNRLEHIVYLRTVKTQVMKKVFIPLMAIGLLAACGEAPKQSEEKEEVKSMVEEHDHEHPSGESSGPAMPAVPEGSRIYFANLEDGATISSPVYIEFGAEGIKVEPAGEVKEGYGHHHILINETFTPLGEAVPADETHIHYGGGQTGDTLDLPAGDHTLTLQFADGIHRSYGEALSASIRVTVE